MVNANLTIAAMFGVERGSLIGKPFSPFIHRDDQDTFYFHRRKLIDTNNKQTYELRLVKQDGPQFHVQMECLPVLDEQGNVAQVRVAVTDITERKQAEEARREYSERLEELVQQRTAELQESETRYRAVSELTSDYAYAYWLEPDGELVKEWATGALVCVTGYSRQELQLLGGWEHLIHPEDKTVPQNQLQTLLSNQTQTVEYRIVTKDGQVHWMRDYARPTWNPEESRDRGLSLA